MVHSTRVRSTYSEERVRPRREDFGSPRATQVCGYLGEEVPCCNTFRRGGDNWPSEQFLKGLSWGFWIPSATWGLESGTHLLPGANAWVCLTHQLPLSTFLTFSGVYSSFPFTGRFNPSGRSWDFLHWSGSAAGKIRRTRIVYEGSGSHSRNRMRTR